MIVDSHAHIFPPMGGPAGHSSSKQHLRYLQHLLLFHHMPVHRADTGEVVDMGPLYDGEDMSINGLIDVDYRADEFGRFAWTIDGVDYWRTYLPPAMANLSSPPEMILAQMDHNGVDKAVIQTGHAYGRLNRYISDAVKKFPDRFWGLAMIDEWNADKPGQIKTLDRTVNELGLHGLWFQTSNLPQHRRKELPDDPVFYPFWDHVRDMKIPVYWFVTSTRSSRELYMEQLASFGRWVKRYPDVPVMYTHGHPLSRFMDGGKISIPEEAWEPLTAPNVMVELLIPIFQGAIWEYPYEEAQPTIREYYDRLGADKLAWASDMPDVERHCTYKQSLDYLRKFCTFIPPSEMDKICGDNVARLFGGNSTV